MVATIAAKAFSQVEVISRSQSQPILKPTRICADARHVALGGKKGSGKRRLSMKPTLERPSPPISLDGWLKVSIERQLLGRLLTGGFGMKTDR